MECAIAKTNNSVLMKKTVFSKEGKERIYPDSCFIGTQHNFQNTSFHSVPSFNAGFFKFLPPNKKKMDTFLAIQQFCCAATVENTPNYFKWE